jgi:hypothetical protein
MAGARHFLALCQRVRISTSFYFGDRIGARTLWFFDCFSKRPVYVSRNLDRTMSRQRVSAAD